MDTAKPDRSKEALDTVLDLFGRDDAPAIIAHVTLAAMTGDMPSAKWSLGNRLVMYSHGTTDARGFKQWKAAGRQVRKGSRAFYILGPKTFKKHDDVTGEDTIGISGFVAIPVFAIEDTDGDAVTQPDYDPPELPPLYNVAEAFGVSVRYVPYSERWLGCYRFGKEEILLATHDTKVFFHELAHAAHKRVDGKLTGGQVAGQEIIAETVGAVLAVLYDVDVEHIGWAKRYVEGHTKAVEPNAAKLAMRHLSKIQKVLDLILTTAGDQEVAGDLVAA